MRNTLKIIETFYETEAFSSFDLLDYGKKDTYKILHMPLEKFRGKIPNELISKLIEPCFLQNRHFDEIMGLLLENIDNESLYFLVYTAYYKVLLESKYIINSDHLFSDLDIIAGSDKALARHLMTTAIDANSLRSIYHGIDMDILKGETDYRVELLNLITTNLFSLNSLYHNTDMELLTGQKNDEIFYSMLMVAEDRNSLGSEYHMYDMNLINGMEDAKMTIPLSILAISKDSLDGDHLDHLESVLNCETHEEANDYVTKLLCKKR